MLQICGGICGGEDAWGGNVYLGGRSNLSGAVQQRADDWRRKVGQCQTWTKYKVYVDTSRLMEESLRTASTILMATTRLWATRLSLMGSLSSERRIIFYFDKTTSMWELLNLIVASIFPQVQETASSSTFQGRQGQGRIQREIDNIKGNHTGGGPFSIKKNRSVGSFQQRRKEYDLG